MERLRPIACALALLASLLPAATAHAAPELVVRIDGQVVNNHHEMVFPDVEVGDSAQIVVTLRNESAEDLVFSEDPPVQLSGGFAESYALIQPALEVGGKLSPNASTAFALRFEPTIRFANLFTHVYLWTNADGAPFHLSVRGKAIAPVLAVTRDGTAVSSGASIDAAPLATGALSQMVFVIRNEGDAALVFEGDPLVEVSGPDAALFEVVPPALEVGGQLSPNSSSAFALRVVEELTENRTLNATITLETNDGSFVLNLVGDAVSGDESSWGAVKSRY